MSAPRDYAGRPWGHWLRLEHRRDLRTPEFIDTDGRSWRSVREAFWCGRLGMPLADGDVPDDEIERVHSILAARLLPGSNRVFPDILSNLTTTRFMHSWLASAGLLVDDARHPVGCGLTEEAVSVVRMLDLTRPLAVGQQRPGRASIDELMATMRGSRPDEERRARIEANAGGWEVAFLRRMVAGHAAVVLTRRGDGPIQAITTVWMLRFPDVHSRDGFYDWLCNYLDRWPAWGAIAGAYAGPELTSHLLQVIASETGSNGSATTSA